MKLFNNMSASVKVAPIIVLASQALSYHKLTDSAMPRSSAPPVRATAPMVKDEIVARTAEAAPNELPKMPGPGLRIAFMTE